MHSLWWELLAVESPENIKSMLPELEGMVEVLVAVGEGGMVIGKDFSNSSTVEMPTSCRPLIDIFGGFIITVNVTLQWEETLYCVKYAMD